MSYKDLKQPLAGDAPTMSKDEPKRDAPANEPGETTPEADQHEQELKNNEHGSGHGHSDAEKKPT